MKTNSIITNSIITNSIALESAMSYPIDNHFIQQIFIKPRNCICHKNDGLKIKATIHKKEDIILCRETHFKGENFQIEILMV
jgi:hypothetical protein